MEEDSIDLIVKFVEEGLGAGIVSESGVRKTRRKGSVGRAYIPGHDTQRWDMGFLHVASRGLSYVREVEDAAPNLRVDRRPSGVRNRPRMKKLRRIDNRTADLWYHFPEVT